MAAVVTGVGLVGIEGVLVEIQVGRIDGLPGIELTGLPAATMREARHRVRSALRVGTFDIPDQRLVANFAPADLPKAGTAYDLPLAIAILVHSGQLPAERVEGAVFFGELALDGAVRAVPGAINAALAVRAAERRTLFVAPGVAAEAAAVPDVEVIAAPSLVELVRHLAGEVVLPASSAPQPPAEPGQAAFVDLASVVGQLRGRRAVEVAAAGGHNLMMVGPPGCGKTLLARALAGVLPPMTLDECIEVTRIHSISGLRQRARAGLARRRPFRAPHATASYAALVGGGNPPRPGEVSLAHRGVLFLDEMPEFQRSALEALRAPLEDREVTISRSGRQVVFPASFSLIGALNPCPCGHRGDPGRACRCTPQRVADYRRRLSGPLLDRVDLHVELEPVPPEALARGGGAESSAAVRERVVRARARALARNRCGGAGVANAELDLEGLERWAPLGSEERLHLARAARRLGLSARSWHRILRVARTVADLAGREQVTRTDLSEALTYRVFDREHEPPRAWAGGAA